MTLRALHEAAKYAQSLPRDIHTELMVQVEGLGIVSSCVIAPIDRHHESRLIRTVRVIPWQELAQLAHADDAIKLKIEETRAEVRRSPAYYGRTL